MNRFVFPEEVDLEGVVSDYFDSLHHVVDGAIDKNEVVSECVASFAQLIRAWKRVDSSGPVAEQIWMTFMRDLLLTKVRLDAADEPPASRSDVRIPMNGDLKASASTVARINGRHNVGGGVTL